mgnify:CR=1 FL=1
MVGTKRVYAAMPTYKQKKRKATSLKTEVFRLKKQLQSQRNVGFVDNNLSPVAIENGGGDIDAINLVAEGTNDDERLGNKMTMTSLRYRCHAVPGTSQTIWQRAQIYFVYDKQPNGALPTATDVLEDDSSFTFPNWANKERFQILRQHSFLVAPAGEGGPPNDVIEGYVKLNHVTNHDAVTAAITSITTGSLFTLVVGNGTSGTNANPGINVNTRVTFSQ